MMNISQQIATELDVTENRVKAAIELLDDGSTVPFIARYRKEATQGLDDTQLRFLEQRLGYLRELESRRTAIVKSIAEQGKLTEALEAKLLAADSKTELEDLYLPFKPKRRTKAQIAREAGLEPLADTLLDDPTQNPESLAEQFINAEAGFTNASEILDGAKQILMEQFAERADLLAELRAFFWENAVLASRLVTGQEENGSKFSDYFDYQEKISKIPSHRSLALFRGRNEGVLQLSLDLTDLQPGAEHPCERMIAKAAGFRHQGRAADDFLQQAVRWTWKVKLHSKLDIELLGRLREQAEEKAIAVFAHNLKDLLLAAPAGPKVVLGLDPGLRTGVKVAVVDGTGKLLDTVPIYPHAPRNAWDESLHQLAALVKKHQIRLIAIGNGTASRETDKLAGELVKQLKDAGLAKIV
ncbi:MAG: RNA-binding transcriptional accessory protein, partial [Gammaproteobacteria bacterium]|nr:RNA-binding transcriptional accessory protein [Gammaproteobacteria bacterium]